jgi:hypothetical protein
VSASLSEAVPVLPPAGVEGGITQDQLLANFRDDVWSNTCVMLLRFITSAEIKRRADHFEPFVVVSLGFWPVTQPGILASDAQGLPALDSIQGRCLTCPQILKAYFQVGYA